MADARQGSTQRSLGIPLNVHTSIPSQPSAKSQFTLQRESEAIVSAWDPWRFSALGCAAGGKTRRFRFTSYQSSLPGVKLVKVDTIDFYYNILDFKMQ